MNQKPKSGITEYDYEDLLMEALDRTKQRVHGSLEQVVEQIKEELRTKEKEQISYTTFIENAISLPFELRKVYLHILETGRATSARISQSCKIDPRRLSRILIQLVQSGLIQSTKNSKIDELTYFIPKTKKIPKIRQVIAFLEKEEQKLRNDIENLDLLVHGLVVIRNRSLVEKLYSRFTSVGNNKRTFSRIAKAVNFISKEAEVLAREIISLCAENFIQIEQMELLDVSKNYVSDSPKSLLSFLLDECEPLSDITETEQVADEVNLIGCKSGENSEIGKLMRLVAGKREIEFINLGDDDKVIVFRGFYDLPLTSFDSVRKYCVAYQDSNDNKREMFFLDKKFANIFG